MCIRDRVKHLAGADGKQTGSRREPRSKVDPREFQELVAEVRPDDGLDPRDEALRLRRAQRDSRPGFAHGVHKQEQFLEQVRMAVESALQTAGEPVLGELSVMEVVKQGGSLLVVATSNNPAEPVDAAEATEALSQASSMISREVAASITRKEVPKLAFIVLPPGAQKVEE
eukprot:TRINITY_DN5754_c0_g1_i3.p2 TRINITY_DN5754_c0_g1~~TRINITY_DN5754_c0_g1_i3.p2  ORF type:complete len:171 (+),score=13.55 TRINITY_DN5754_c0_g1_i3:134-646(+)